MVVYIGKDGDGYPFLQVIDGSNATGSIDPVTDLLTEGYAVLEKDEFDKPVLEAHFRPYQTDYYQNGKIIDSMSKFKDKIFEKIHSNPQLQILLKKIRSGKADFKNTSQYADLFSKIMGSEFSEIIPQIPQGTREQLCIELLRGSYENINEILAQVQNSIDKEKGIRLAP